MWMFVYKGKRQILWSIPFANILDLDRCEELHINRTCEMVKYDTMQKSIYGWMKS